MVKLTYRGLCAPVFTFFNDDMTINTQVVPKYARYLADNGVDGILVNGTSGEGMSLSVSERKTIVEEWRKAVKATKQHLMVQVGGCPLPDVLELARHAEKIGVDSLLCLPELYFKPSTAEEITNYLKVVGAAAPKTPLLYYHIPAWTGVNVNMAQCLKQSIGKIPTFQGIKYTSNDLDGGIAAFKANSGNYAVFLGADTLMASAFTMGFDSVIATTLNILPHYAFKIKKAIEESKVKEARVLQNKLSDACSVITKYGAWVPTMKVAMTLITEFQLGKVREPLTNLTSEQVEDMQKSLKKLGVI